MVVLTFIVAITAVAVSMTSHQGRLSRSSMQHSRSIALVDSQSERMFNDWRLLMNTMPLGQKPTAAQIDALNLPLPASAAAVHPGFGAVYGSFLASLGGVDTYKVEEIDVYGGVVPVGTYNVSTGPLPGFDGFFAINHTYRSIVGFQTQNLGSSTPAVLVERTFTRSEAPVFQAGLYYEDDLELHPGESMYMSGPVMTNHRLYASVLNSKQLTFGSNVLANKTPNDPVPGIVYNNRRPADPGYVEGLPPGSAYTSSNYTTPSYLVNKARQLRLNNRLEPAGRELRDEFNTADANPNNDGFRELIEKPDTSAVDPGSVANARLYTQATLRVSVTEVAGVQTVSATGLNGAALPAAVLTKIQAAIGTRTPIYDKRENTSVTITPVDVTKLAEAEQLHRSLTGSNNSLTGIVYFSDDAATTGQKWGFRLENAAKLPSAEQPANAPAHQRGFTVASAGGIYLKGNYNTDTSVEAVPASVMADAVMFLSNNWNDTRAGNPLNGVDDGAGGIVPGSARLATETTYRAAIMAGTIPSAYDPTPGSPSSGDEYGPSGGAHNFPRMLEKWTGVNMNFKGAMVQLFTSKMFTGQWQTGDVYYPPQRVWSSNENFVRRPSPGLFAFSIYSRGPWRRL